MEVSVTQQIPECEKDRQGGRDSHQREEIVGSAASFIAALMSPGTHRLETAVLFSPPPRSTNPIQLLTHRNTCTFRAGHTGAHRLPHTIHCKATHKRWGVFSVSVRHSSTKMIFVTSWSESRRWKRLHLFRKLLSCCKVFCLTSWHALKELG